MQCKESMHMSVIAEVRDLVKYYRTGDNVVKAVDHIDLEIDRKSVV